MTIKGKKHHEVFVVRTNRTMKTIRCLHRMSRITFDNVNTLSYCDYCWPLLLNLLYGLLLGRVDGYSFFDCSSPFCFLLIEFHCTFSISYKILQSYVYYYCIYIM